MLHETSVLLGWFISNLQVACDLEDARNAVRTKTGNLLVSLIDDNADQGRVPILNDDANRLCRIDRVLVERGIAVD